MPEIRKETDNFTLGDSDDPKQDIEEIRFYTADSYNDNVDLIGCNSDFRDSKTGKIVGVMDFYENEQECRIRYCPHCQEYGLKHMLGALMIKDQQKRPDDWENWLQCHFCASIYPRFLVETQKSLKADIKQHVEENPHEAKNTIAIGAYTVRNSKEGKRILDQRRRDKSRAHYADKEIDPLLRTYGEENVKIYTDTSQ